MIVHHGLACFFTQIDNFQTPVSQGDIAVYMNTQAVRSTAEQRPGHRIDMIETFRLVS